MKIGILSRNPSLYSTKRLVEACKERGHSPVVIDPLDCYMNITSHKPSVHFKAQDLDDLQAIIPRIGASVTFFGTAVLRQFEITGCYALNGSLAINRARDKLRALQILSRKKVGLPSTAFAHSTSKIDDLLNLVGGAPLVIKLLQGTQGRGVVLAETRAAAESVIEAFRGLDAHFLVQEFIKEANGCDIRCFVIGGKVVASMQRKSKEGEFRSNLHRGGTASPVRITKEERALAIKASRAMGLNVSGVDLMRSSRGPLILEVNSTPGLEGIEKTTQQDIAGMIVEFIERNVPANPGAIKQLHA